MSIEGGNKNYTPEQIAAFEKSRIQDPEKAKEMADMLSVETGENKPTADDYERALEKLELFEEVARNESPSAIDNALRNFIAGFGVTMEKSSGLFLAAVRFVDPTSTPKTLSERGGFVEQMKNLGTDFKEMRARFGSAREKLEAWRKEAVELEKRKNDASK